MRCRTVDETKPLDRLLDQKSDEFNSGEERTCDKDLDEMIWKFGDYENEEPTQEAESFEEELPIEEELVEGRRIVGGTGRPASTRGSQAAETISDGVKLASAHSIGRETRKKKR